MKFTKILAVALSVAAAATFTACNNDDQPQGPQIEYIYLNTIDNFTESDYWSGCYDVTGGTTDAYGTTTAVNPIKVSGFEFSHTANSSAYGDWWTGFCPSRVNDTDDHKGNWLDYQWASIAQNPRKGVFMVGCSNSQVSDNVLDNDACTLKRADGGYFMPQYVFINNSSYTYYSAKDGSDFNKPFTANDKLSLKIVGVRNGAITARLDAPMILEGNFLTEWTGIVLTDLGVVDKILFYVDSNDKGEFGINPPAYFCLADFAYTLPVTTSEN